MSMQILGILLKKKMLKIWFNSIRSIKKEKKKILLFSNSVTEVLGNSIHSSIHYKLSYCYFYLLNITMSEKYSKIEF